MRLTFLAAVLVLTGCTATGTPPVIAYQPVPIQVYHPPMPTGADLQDIEFHVITRENIEQKVTELSAQLGGNFVVFAVTPKGYENLAYNLQELRRVIREYRSQLEYYRNATSTNPEAEETSTSATSPISDTSKRPR